MHVLWWRCYFELFSLLYSNTKADMDHASTLMKVYQPRWRQYQENPVAQLLSA